MSRQRLPLPKGCPAKLIYHGQTFDLFATGDGRLAFDHYAGGRRVVVRRTTLAKLRAAAEEIALSIVNAETAARDLTAEDRRIYIAARHVVHPRLVDAICRDAAEAHAIAGPDISLAELARFYKARKEQFHSPPASEILTELLAVLRESSRSHEHVIGLDRDLKPFVVEFPDLATVTEKQVTAHLRARRGRDLQPLNSRRRDNIRDAIVRLFTFARDRQYLPDRKTEAEKVSRVDEGISEVTTYTPTEIRTMLAHLPVEWRPWFLIAAFAGLRTSEIFRLEWRAIDLQARIISIGRRVAKKVKTSRKVPIPENLAEFLADYSERVGALYPNKPTHGLGRTWSSLWKAQHRALKTLTSRCGLRWEKNALRHSYGSHRLAVIKNEAQLVVEMGNSIQQVREHYNDPKSAAEAESYFAIKPSIADNILHLPLVFSTAG